MRTEVFRVSRLKSAYSGYSGIFDASNCLPELSFPSVTRISAESWLVPEGGVKKLTVGVDRSEAVVINVVEL